MNAALNDALERIFATCPGLCGFSLQDDPDLSFADLALNPGYESTGPLLGTIVEALRELIDEQPDALELLRGRTFARTLH